MRKILAKEWLYFICISSFSIMLNITFTFYNAHKFYTERRDSSCKNKEYFYREITSELIKRSNASKENEANSLSQTIIQRKTNSNISTGQKKIISPPTNDLEGVINFIKEDTTKPLSKLQQWAIEYPFYQDSAYPIGTIDQFYDILNDQYERGKFEYCVLTINGESVLKNAHRLLYDELILPIPNKPKIVEISESIITGLFLKRVWLNNWLSLLWPYLVFVFFRTLIYSVKIIKNK